MIEGWEHRCGFIKSELDARLSYVPFYCPRCESTDIEWIPWSLEPAEVEGGEDLTKKGQGQRIADAYGRLARALKETDG